MSAPDTDRTPTGWYCSCGHPNGINLATCACCDRRPGGPENPIEMIFSPAPAPVALGVLIRTSAAARVEADMLAELRENGTTTLLSNSTVDRVIALLRAVAAFQP